MTPDADITEAPASTRLPRGRRYAVRGLLGLATVLAIVSIFAVWANRQLLNADNWANTSTALLENQAVRTQVSGLLVDQLYANVDVSAELSSALPTRLKPLAGPAAGGLRSLAEQVTDKALGRPVVQQAWRTANRVAAQQFINIAENKSKAITATSNAVYLNLGIIVTDLAQRLGLPTSLTSKIPADAGQLKIMSGGQVSALQDGASALRGFAVVLPLLSVVLLALAVFLARGRRRQTLLAVGFDLILAGAIVLVARTVIGNQVVSSLAKTDAVKPAAHATWSIGTSMLHDVAWATIVIGIPVIVAAWLAGPMRPARAFRHAVAPWLEERPAIAYGVVAALLLLVIAWGPIPATQQILPVLLMIVLVVAGVEALRRQTAVEYPGASVDATRASVRASLTRAGEEVRGWGGRLRDMRSGDGGHAGAAGNGAAEDRLAQLERLAALHDRGVLTDEEFANEKAALLGPGRNGA